MRAATNGADLERIQLTLFYRLISVEIGFTDENTGRCYYSLHAAARLTNRRARQTARSDPEGQ